MPTLTLRLLAGLLLILHSVTTYASRQPVLSDLDYLPTDVSYDAAIPTPAEVLGHPVGTWHVRHDQLVSYMYALAEASPRVTVTETGRTHENRPLLLLTISSEQNQADIDNIKANHMANIQQGKAASDNAPLILWMGYSVHGNEPSGSNASLLVAYYLAAGQGEQVEALLNNTVVLLDPSVNPDGLSRFAQWANMHKGQNLVADPNHREHREHWPSGRTNHYWFDLNRDWLLLTHPESRARINQYHQWRPHVLTDFHEMGTNSTYFFQPGIPSRKNPWTPIRNVELTGALAQYHAAALDADKQLYFTEESFDDFYFGKGSTYPDAHGSIGILFEQASSRGHLQDSINGPLHFSDTIQNQVTTSLSTFAGSLAHRQDLHDYQVDFASQTSELIKDDELYGYLIQESKDNARFNRMLEILTSHQIKVMQLGKAITLEEQQYLPQHSVFVPLNQPQYRLIRSLFSTRTSFDDNTFYDVSNWNLALAFNLQYTPVNKSQRRKLTIAGSAQPRQPAVVPSLTDGTAGSHYAYAFEWFDYNAPAMLQSLLSRGIQVRVAGEAFSAKTSSGIKDFAAGSVIIPTALQQPAELIAVLAHEAAQWGIELHPINSGLTPTGIDFGSRKMLPVKPVKVMLVGGLDTSQYEVGEIWHYLDTRVAMAPTLVDLDRMSGVNLSDYSHIVFASGRYNDVSDKLAKSIGDWVNQGGVLIGQKSAARWFAKKGWLKTTVLENKDIDDAFDSAGLPYAERDALAAKKLIAGAAFGVDIDLTHPLAFGMQSAQMPLFKTNNMVMQAAEKPFINVARYQSSPLLAGYTADELQKLIANTAAIIAHRKGRGRVIAFADNLNFRGYWYGSSRLLSNAIFMSGFVQGQG